MKQQGKLNRTEPLSQSRWRRRCRLIVMAASLGLVSVFVQSALADDGRKRQHWVGTWSTSMMWPYEANYATCCPPPVAQVPSVNNQTLRLVVRTSIGGRSVRIRLSNTFGESALTIDASSIAIHAGGGDLVPGSLRELRFGGEPSVTIARGARVFSDPVQLEFEDQADLAVSLFLAEDSGLPTVHNVSKQTSYIGTDTGDLTQGEAGSAFDELIVRKDVNVQGFDGWWPWYFLSGVDVLADHRTHAVVTLGDSITDGVLSTLDANARYPNFLASRLLKATSKKGRHRSKHRRQVAVLNAGIGGTRVLNDTIHFGESAQTRLDRDVLTQSGVKWVIFLAGINDIGFPEIGFAFPEGTNVDPVSADQIIAGMKQIITRSHARGLKIFGGTLLPCQPFSYCTDAAEEKRQAVNSWIRESEAFDAVIDFDAAIRDPDNPSQMLPEYDGGDSLHPGDAGYEAMARAIDLRLFGLKNERDDDD